MEKNIKKRVIRLISDNLGIEESKIKETSYLVDDLSADSLDLIELSIALEEEFDVEIPDKTMEKLKTIQDIITYLRKNCKKDNK